MLDLCLLRALGNGKMTVIGGAAQAIAGMKHWTIRSLIIQQNKKMNLLVQLRYTVACGTRTKEEKEFCETWKSELTRKNEPTRNTLSQ